METVVLKIGGSILSPSTETLFDYSAALKIKETLETLLDQYKFVLSIGGGGLAKKYQELVRENGGNEREINWIGTSACNHNAVMMRIALGDSAEDIAITGQAVNEEHNLEFEKNFLVVGAADPGHSSDYDAVLMAKRTGSKRIISLKNVDGVYSDDPKKNPEAIKYEDLDWNTYRKDILKTNEFTPKMAVPVDPIAALKAQKMGLTFIIIDGSDLNNIIKTIKEENFTGTIIHP